MRIAVLPMLILAAAASGAAAQPASAPADPAPASPHVARPRDPIASLLNPNAPESRDEDEPDTAGQAKSAAEP
ncbi:MAG: hypothetical protein JSR98_02535, partial [Proteobacteria bacterium]|nr:hypothetical protein [Pseudomonadota bacterium]